MVDLKGLVGVNTFIESFARSVCHSCVYV